MNWQYLFCYMVVDITCLVVGVAIARNLHGDSGSELQVKYFRAVVVTYVAFVVTDMCWALLQISAVVPPGYWAIVAFNLLNKVCVVTLAYFWFCYGESRLDSPIVYDRRLRRLAALPLALTPILYIAGALAGHASATTNDGGIVNESVYIALSGIAVAYMLFVTVHALRKLRSAQTRAQRAVCLSLVAFVVMPIVSAVVDVLVPNMPVAAPGIMISLLLISMSLQESRISSDALTGLNNRRRADEFLDDMLQKASPQSPVHFFLVDMDRFKGINDTYGHLEGDRALKLMATALKKTCGENDAFAARWGGDEFVVISMHDDASGVPAAIERHLEDEVRARELDYHLGCTVGRAVCTDSAMQASALLGAADKDLYERKQAKKATWAQKAATPAAAPPASAA